MGGRHGGRRRSLRIRERSLGQSGSSESFGDVLLQADIGGFKGAHDAGSRPLARPSASLVKTSEPSAFFTEASVTDSFVTERSLAEKSFAESFASLFDGVLASSCEDPNEEAWEVGPFRGDEALVDADAIELGITPYSGLGSCPIFFFISSPT